MTDSKAGDGEYAIWRRSDGRFVAMPSGKDLKHGVLICYTTLGRSDALRLARVFAEDVTRIGPGPQFIPKGTTRESPRKWRQK